MQNLVHVSLADDTQGQRDWVPVNAWFCRKGKPIPWPRGSHQELLPRLKPGSCCLVSSWTPYPLYSSPDAQPAPALHRPSCYSFHLLKYNSSAIPRSTPFLVIGACLGLPLLFRLALWKSVGFVVMSHISLLMRVLGVFSPFLVECCWDLTHSENTR